MKRVHLLLIAMLLVVLAVPMTVAGQQITYNAGFQVQNLDTANPAAIEITFYNQDGTVAAQLSSETVPAGGSNTYFPLTAVSEGFNGSVVISSDREVRAIANVLGNGLDYGASYSGFTEGATTVYIPLLMKNNNGYSTWFNIQNTGSAPTAVTVNYSDGETASCNLQPGAACTLRQTDENHADGWVGSATVSTDGQPVAVAVMEVGPTTLFAYSGFTGGSTEVVMPLINANNAGYITGVQIMNMGTVTTEVTLGYTPSAAGTACQETRTIPPGKSETFALFAFGPGDTTTTCTEGETFVGSAKVTSNSADQNLVAIVNQLNMGENKGAAYEGFDPNNATATVVMPLIMDRNSNYWTGFSVMNVGTVTTTISCSFSDATYSVEGDVGPGAALANIQNGQISEGYVGSATCTAAGGGKIVGVVNELNPALTGDAFLVYGAFNQ